MFGINIGNTNASIAFCKENGLVNVITNEDGDRLTPAVVAISDDEITVGTAAQVAEISNAKSTITANKSLMGRAELTNLNSHYNIDTEVKNNEIYYRIPFGEKNTYLLPQNIAKFIFEELLVTAKRALGIDTSSLSCVLLMPGNFSDSYCDKYKKAAEAAGWQVVQVINEAAAAILAHSLLASKDEPPQNIIVYRLGGTTCEITGCEISEGMVTTLGSTRKEDIGGKLFTDFIADFLADEFFRKYKLDPRENRRSMEKLKRAGQNCMHVLSKLQTSTCFIESLHGGIDFSVNLSRARFELLLRPLLEKCIEPLKLLLDELKLNGSVDKVILCGGTTNIPRLQNSIASVFDQSLTQILTHTNPEEVLAIGGAKQAYYLHSNDCQGLLPRTMDISCDTTDMTYETCF